jgi:hypothetical protein
MKLIKLKRKQWFKKKEESFTDVQCKNCETTFSGKFCPQCGQSVKEFDKSLSFVIYDFAGNFFAFDTRFFHTFLYLLIRPGFLTNEFVKGRRASYAPPFRIFIFVSFVLFFLLQQYTSSTLKTVLEREIDLADTTLFNSNSVAKLEIDVDTTDLNQAIEKLEPFFDLTKKGSVNKRLNEAALKLEKEIQDTDNPEEKQDQLNLLRKFQNPELLTSQFFKYLSWAFFLLLPIFALILKLFYSSHKINYIRHLLFTVHVHSFIFLIFTIIIATVLIFGGIHPIFVNFLILAIPVYFLIAVYKVYKQSLIKSMVKILLISIIYNLILISTISLVMAKSLSLL